MGPLLVCDATAPVTGVGGLALLSIFTGTLLGLRVRYGNTEVKCNCFGKLPILSTALSPVARNCTLSGLIIVGTLTRFTILTCLLLSASCAILGGVVGWLASIVMKRST